MKLPDFGLERYFAKYEFNSPFLLCCSDCQSFSLGEVLDMEPGSSERMRDLWLGYTESSGNPELKEEIARLYSSVDPDQILVHAGAEETIFNFMNVVLDKGDHAIVHFPCYQSLFEVAESIGCEVTRWRTREEDRWTLDIDFLKDAVKPNTKAVIINTPHNPTGYLASQETFREIIDLSHEHGFLVFSDEVYRFLEYDPADRLPALCDLDENGLSLGVMSKAYGLPGLRIGWIATRNRELYARMAAFKDYTTICNSAPSEFISTIALRNRKRIVERNLKIVRDNLETLNRFFEKYEDRFNWTPPKAGPIAFPSLRGERDVVAFCRDLVDKSGVLLLPGTLYDASRRNFRIGFGRSNVPECLQHLDGYLSGNI